MGATRKPIDTDTLLREAGIAPRTVDTVSAIDAMLQNWRRRALRRELGHRALEDLKIGLDLAQLDVLVAISAPVDEFGEASGGETMVASVAERLTIDPSRASRLVSEMVDQGYARRAVSQADARRSIVQLTEAGEAVVEAVRAYKFLILGDFLSSWSAEEIAAFMPLLRKFSQWAEHTDVASRKFADDIAVLAERLQRLQPERLKSA